MDIFNPVIDDILNLVEEQVERVQIKMGGRSPKVWRCTLCCYQLRKELKLTAYSIFFWLEVLVAIDI